MILYSALVTLMSGSVIPLNLFPDFLVKIISWSPFPYLYYYPTTVLIGTPIQMTYEELLLRYFLELTIVGSITFSIYFSGKKNWNLLEVNMDSTQIKPNTKENTISETVYIYLRIATASIKSRMEYRASF